MTVPGASACKIVVGLPTSAREIDDYLAEPRGRDMLAAGAAIQRYRKQVVAPFAVLAPQWQACGAKVYAGATLTTLASALDDGPTQVLLLISHWVDEPSPRIEFFDGMHAIHAVVATLPSAFDGVVDLCICQSLALAKQIASRCPAANVRWVNVEATPVVWFHTYTLAFRLMCDKRCDYLSALAEAMEILRYGA